MSDAISLQCSFFLFSVLWGIIILVIYDVLRIIRRIKKHKWFTIAAEDFLFWILAAFLIFRFMYEENNGMIRGFAVLGMGLGMVIYNRSLSSYFVDGISRIFLFTGKQIYKFLCLISKPFRSFGRFIKCRLRVLGKITAKSGKRLTEPLKKAKKSDTIEEQTRN